MRTVVSIVELSITGVLVLRMIIAGFLQPPGQVFSWPMFTRGCQIDVELQIREPGKDESTCSA